MTSSSLMKDILRLKPPQNKRIVKRGKGYRQQKEMAVMTEYTPLEDLDTGKKEQLVQIL